MALYRETLPQTKGGMFLAYTGMETDLLFTQNVDLPGFASYPLLEAQEGRDRLAGYFQGLVDIGKSAGTGVILESPTWVANRDRGAAIGYTPEQLTDLNKQAVAFMCDFRKSADNVPIVISANIGPRDDAYAPSEQMTADEARVYHSEQIAALAQTDVDVISGYTVAYAAEAIGMVLAACAFDLPIVIAFTVETDGKLPTGQSLQDAIEEVDAATEGYTSYFMINCAHPDHFDGTITNEPWAQRLRGIVANASRCSHAELDNATELDDGDPVELGSQIGAIVRQFPQITVVGGCCGTDMRHMSQIAASVTSAD